MRFTKIFVLVALVALVIAPAAFALRFTDDSFNTPTGETGKAYSFQFHGAGGCGPALPYQYKLLAASLPPGLSLVLQRPGQRHSRPTAAAIPSGSSSATRIRRRQSWCVPSPQSASSRSRSSPD